MSKQKKERPKSQSHGANVPDNKPKDYEIHRPYAMAVDAQPRMGDPDAARGPSGVTLREEYERDPVATMNPWKKGSVR